MKNILLLIHDDDGQESRLQVALDVTRALRGHLECLDVKTLPLLVTSYHSIGAEDAMIAAESEREAAHRALLESRLAKEDVPWSMGETYGTFAEALVQASDFADLIVVSSRANEGANGRPHPERLPLKAQRPVLAVPPACKGLDTEGCALIAWDGSRPCGEAVRATVPLLQRAGQVVLLEVNQPQGSLAMTEVATYLSRHGVAPVLVERTATGLVADIILDQARHSGAAFIVMGAYSKPRAAEAVFGGVTRTMLVKADIPLLLAH
jgi:nucleotide-binding universal stress UspA family protein